MPEPLTARFKGLAALEQIVIAFNHENAGARIEAADGGDPFGQLVESAVNQVAGDEDELGTEIVHRRGHLAEDGAAGESARVHVAYVRDGEAIESGGKIADGDRSGGGCGIVRAGGGRNAVRPTVNSWGVKAAVAARKARRLMPTSPVGALAVLSRSDFANYPENEGHDPANDSERNDEGHDKQMPKVNRRHDELGQLVPRLRSPG